MRRYALFLLSVVAISLLRPRRIRAGNRRRRCPLPRSNWVAITSGFAMAIASAAGGYAQAKATAAACEGLARNPGAAAAIRFALILALVLIESMALYTFAIVCLKVGSAQPKAKASTGPDACRALPGLLFFNSARFSCPIRPTSKPLQTNGPSS